LNADRQFGARELPRRFATRRNTDAATGREIVWLSAYRNPGYADLATGNRDRVGAVDVRLHNRTDRHVASPVKVRAVYGDPEWVGLGRWQS